MSCSVKVVVLAADSSVSDLPLQLAQGTSDGMEFARRLVCGKGSPATEYRVPSILQYLMVPGKSARGL